MQATQATHPLEVLFSAPPPTQQNAIATPKDDTRARTSANSIGNSADRAAAGGAADAGDLYLEAWQGLLVQQLELAQRLCIADSTSCRLLAFLGLCKHWLSLT